MKFTQMYFAGHTRRLGKVMYSGLDQMILQQFRSLKQSKEAMKLAEQQVIRWLADPDAASPEETPGWQLSMIIRKLAADQGCKDSLQDLQKNRLGRHVIDKLDLKKVDEDVITWCKHAANALLHYGHEKFQDEPASRWHRALYNAADLWGDIPDQFSH